MPRGSRPHSFIEANGKAYEEEWQHGKRIKRTLVTTMILTGSAGAAQTGAPSAATSLNGATTAARLPAANAAVAAAGAAAAGSSSSAGGPASSRMADAGVNDLVLGLDAATLVGGPQIARAPAAAPPRSAPKPPASGPAGGPAAARATVVGGDDLVILD